ncbi:GNAT family N-acetyltransferase [Kiloniella litopenaei]|uniref:GNAT family N-acetyltransferase n=1 Tax=Kiloniella litopenaei TaxID=1549748 RepID=UPI000A702A10|nr:GNAT family N-acetyltransferase [Kiloniella litopenaei]
MSIKIRLAREDDAEELCGLLNEIIEIGGTTAMEESLDVDLFKHYFLTGDHCICCHVSEDEDGAITGFQVLGRHPELPADWADIGTFARVHPRVYGVGKALFPASCAYLERHGFSTINATIRADNSRGLRYYEKMGFTTYKTTKSVPLRDGTLVDRFSKAYHLNGTEMVREIN